MLRTRRCRQLHGQSLSVRQRDGQRTQHTTATRVDTKVAFLLSRNTKLIRKSLLELTKSWLDPESELPPDPEPVPNPEPEPIFSLNDLRIWVLPEPIPDLEPVLDPELVPDPEPVPDPELNLGPLFSCN
jgi:hypothetical protein